MRHKVAGFKLNRDSEHRVAMRRNLAIALFTHGQITTTVPKAKSVRPLVEKLITIARKGDLAARRRVIRAIGDHIMVRNDRDNDVQRNRYGEVTTGPRVVKKLFEEIAPRYADRPGGYTRIVRLGKHRIGDATDLCVLQLVGDEEGPQVSGQYSRRRDKANRRMEFAAKVRKQARAGAEPEQGGTATATAEPETQTQQQAAEASSAEAQDQSKPETEAGAEPERKE